MLQFGYCNIYLKIKNIIFMVTIYFCHPFELLLFLTYRGYRGKSAFRVCLPISIKIGKKNGNVKPLALYRLRRGCSSCYFLIQ
jgi:hypothetical protein